MLPRSLSFPLHDLFWSGNEIIPTAGVAKFDQSKPRGLSEQCRDRCCGREGGWWVEGQKRSRGKKKEIDKADDGPDYDDHGGIGEIEQS